MTTTPPQPAPPQDSDDVEVTAPGDGLVLVIPWQHLLIGGCAAAGLAVMTLILAFPHIGVAVGSGLTTVGLIYTITTSRTDHHAATRAARLDRNGTTKLPLAGPGAARTQQETPS